MDIKININNASLLATAVTKKQYPTSNLPEIALLGRSNVGKSSFINKLLLRKSLARTSSQPGKTQTLNFYNIDNAFTFVDLPGYGYAKVSQSLREQWGKMIEGYLNERQNLIASFLLVDARHKPSPLDITMTDWVRARHGSLNVIATKLDKLKKSEIEPNLTLIYETLNLTDEDCLIPFSAEKGTGRDEAWELIYLMLESSDSL